MRRQGPPAQDARPADDYTSQFTAALRRGVEAVVEAGHVLLNAKAELGFGEWTKWIDEELPVSRRTAQQMMQIARDPNITRSLDDEKRTIGSLLPADKKILLEICDLEPEQFDRFVEERVINPEMKRGDVRAAVVRAAHEAPCLPIEEVPSGRYGAILADPPWQFRGYGSTGGPHSAEAHYPTMTLEEIQSMPVRELALDDAALFLWSTSEMLAHSLEVMACWGFEFKTIAFVWAKTGPFGRGYWTRKRTEHCLLGTVGQPERRSAAVADLIEAPRREHSRKPDELYDRIRALVGGPYIELFARRVPEGWDVWGNDPALRPPAAGSRGGDSED